MIERAPRGEPSSWCHRMVVTRKEDGSPRHTVDLSLLNRHCIREVHTNWSPLSWLGVYQPRPGVQSLMRGMGYHSVPLRPEDRHLNHLHHSTWALEQTKFLTMGWDP